MITGKFALGGNLCKASKSKCMVGKFFQEFFIFLMNRERGCRLELFRHECFEGNDAAQDGSKTSCKREAYPYLHRTVPYRTVPKSRVNAALLIERPTLILNMPGINFSTSRVLNYC